MLISLLLPLPLQANIFKCTVNGNTLFSDRPCADNAVRVEIEARQPDETAVISQQAITQRFQEESRVNQVHSLKQKNKLLSAKIDQLQQDRQRELDRLRQRTYTSDDGRIATREHGLFEEMDRLDAEFQQQIQDLKQEVQHNQQQIHQLYQ
ncbi:DUF4124 domain-containing protein [Methylophaga sp.]|uniref:DUF4124 domain-containing protein n=1 Tax=Methylophaga sp. TaxID=2024840 RepID=UPI0013FF66ED|nr:DUF4124 domain-containing protein [Methylophaga sp.]MTI62986.1 DUF4124 domain-containing protein [Methylophaga sp.]